MYGPKAPDGIFIRCSTCQFEIGILLKTAWLYLEPWQDSVGIGFLMLLLLRQAGSCILHQQKLIS